MTNNNNTHELVVIGAGPAALAAAIYTTREEIETVLYEKGIVGGLAATTDWIDNYPGYMKGIEGLRLADELRGQAERFGAKIEFGDVTKLERQGDLLKLRVDNKDVTAKAVLIATGSNYRKLGVPGEEEYYAQGVHYCATCDGAFYAGKRLVVVGGGNSGVQEAMFLTRFATHIDLLVRSDLRASEVLQRKLETMKDKITVHTNVTVEEIVATGKSVSGVRVKQKATGEERTIETDGVFVFIGLLPNTTFLAGSGVELDEVGLIKSDTNLQTAVPGVFVAGDVRSHATMQIASAVGDGATAALKIREYLEKQEG
ncbi:thioredoxin reductase [Candidatus Saccharibacteria bacterium 32-50-10]|nr:MAG: thioredoxin reductase [Candidatus Saccharibacteria bacterium 32-50-10]